MTNPTYYIHNKYIATGGWQQTTWNWLMGQIGHSGWTLVNVVAEIWNVGVATIEKVKSVATDAWSGAKIGMKFIADYVLIPIVKAFRTMLINSFESLLQVAATFLPIDNLNVLNNQISFDVNLKSIIIDFEINSEDYSIEVIINGQKSHKIHTPFFVPVLETLSVSQSHKKQIDVSMMSTYLAALGSMPIGMYAPVREKVVIPYTLMFLFIQLTQLFAIYATASDKKNTASYLATAFDATADAHTIGLMTTFGLFLVGFLHIPIIAILTGILLTEEYLTEFLIEDRVITGFGVTNEINHPDFDQSEYMDIGQGMYGIIGFTFASMALAGTSSGLPDAAIDAMASITEFVTIMTFSYFILSIIFGLLAK